MRVFRQDACQGEQCPWLEVVLDGPPFLLALQIAKKKRHRRAFLSFQVYTTAFSGCGSPLTKQCGSATPVVLCLLASIKKVERRLMSRCRFQAIEAKDPVRRIFR